jgi:hypothetical protein
LFQLPRRDGRLDRIRTLRVEQVELVTAVGVQDRKRQTDAIVRWGDTGAKNAARIDDFLELFASAGAVATAMMARVATRIGRICAFLLVSIENLLELKIVHIQNCQYSKAYA